jgi:hypothetical protein
MSGKYKYGYNDKGIWFNGDNNRKSSVHTKQTFKGDVVVKFDVTKDDVCSDQNVVLSSNPGYQWSWGRPRDNSVSFVWNCNSKCIYAPKKSKCITCSKKKMYSATITLSGGKIKFDADGCKVTEISGGSGFDSKKDYMVFIGADQDNARKKSGFHKIDISPSFLELMSKPADKLSERETADEDEGGSADDLSGKPSAPAKDPTPEEKKKAEKSCSNVPDAGKSTCIDTILGGEDEAKAIMLGSKEAAGKAVAKDELKESERKTKKEAEDDFATLTAPDQVGVRIEYQTDPKQNWTLVESFPVQSYQQVLADWAPLSVDLPAAALSKHTRLRIIQPEHTCQCCDDWAVDNIRVVQGGGKASVSAYSNFKLFIDGNFIGEGNERIQNNNARFVIPSDFSVVAIEAESLEQTRGILADIGQDLVTDSSWRCTGKEEQLVSHIDKLNASGTEITPTPSANVDDLLRDVEEEDMIRKKTDFNASSLVNGNDTSTAGNTSGVRSMTENTVVELTGNKTLNLLLNGGSSEELFIPSTQPSNRASALFVELESHSDGDKKAKKMWMEEEGKHCKQSQMYMDSLRTPKTSEFPSLLECKKECKENAKCVGLTWFGSSATYEWRNRCFLSLDECTFEDNPYGASAWLLDRTSLLTSTAKAIAETAAEAAKKPRQWAEPLNDKVCAESRAVDRLDKPDHTDLDECKAACQSNKACVALTWFAASTEEKFANKCFFSLSKCTEEESDAHGTIYQFKEATNFGAWIQKDFDDSHWAFAAELGDNALEGMHGLNTMMTKGLRKTMAGGKWIWPHDFGKKAYCRVMRKKTMFAGTSFPEAKRFVCTTQGSQLAPIEATLNADNMEVSLINNTLSTVSSDGGGNIMISRSAKNMPGFTKLGTGSCVNKDGAMNMHFSVRADTNREMCESLCTADASCNGFFVKDNKRCHLVTNGILLKPKSDYEDLKEEDGGLLIASSTDDDPNQECYVRNSVEMSAEALIHLDFLKIFGVNASVAQTVATQVKKVSLRLFVFDESDSELQLCPVKSRWSFGFVSWDHKPNVKDAACKAVAAKEQGWVKFDVTSYARDVLEQPDYNLGLTLRAKGSSLDAIGVRGSKFLDNMQRPQIDISCHGDKQQDENGVENHYIAPEVFGDVVVTKNESAVNETSLTAIEDIGAGAKRALNEGWVQVFQQKLSYSDDAEKWTRTTSSPGGASRVDKQSTAPPLSYLKDLFQNKKITDIDAEDFMIELSVGGKVKSRAVGAFAQVTGDKDFMSDATSPGMCLKSLRLIQKDGVEICAKERAAAKAREMAAKLANRTHSSESESAETTFLEEDECVNIAGTWSYFSGASTTTIAQTGCVGTLGDGQKITASGRKVTIHAVPPVTATLSDDGTELEWSNGINYRRKECKNIAGTWEYTGPTSGSATITQNGCVGDLGDGQRITADGRKFTIHASPLVTTTLSKDGSEMKWSNGYTYRRKACKLPVFNAQISYGEQKLSLCSEGADGKSENSYATLDAPGTESTADYSFFAAAGSKAPKRNVGGLSEEDKTVRSFAVYVRPVNTDDVPLE